MNDARTAITAPQIRREVLELLGYPEHGAPSVRVSCVIVPSKHPSGGTFAKLRVDINEGARTFDLTLMAERLYMSLEDFTATVLAPVILPARRSPATKRGQANGKEKAD